MTREERVGWGNVALFAVVICCLGVAAMALHEVACGGDMGVSAEAGAP
jgi:hypothetical protein